MVAERPSEWDRTTDIVVVGSGTGMAAALAAADAGADVLILEKAPYLGGTTAVSGGGSWAPNSHPVVESTGETPRKDLLTYLKRVTGEKTPREKLERYVDEIPRVFEFIEESTPLELVHAKGISDYHAEFEHGDADGRMVEPAPYDASRLGDKFDHVRDSPHNPLPITYGEIKETAGSALVFPMKADWDLLAERMEEDLVAGGTALIAGMYEALLAMGVEVERTKRILLGLATIVTAAGVAVAGVIGFVGLIVPHVLRLLVGPDHRVLLPTSALAGGAFLVAADTLTRTTPEVLPVGIVTAAAGGPFFLYLLREREVHGL